MTHKFALLSAAIALSSATNAFASTLDASTAAVPQSHAIASSVDPSPNLPSAKFSSAAANTQYWACIAVSHGTGQAGWARVTQSPLLWAKPSLSVVEAIAPFGGARSWVVSR